MGTHREGRSEPRRFPIQLLIGSLIVLSPTALSGGAVMLLDPSGENLGFDTDMLEGLPFITDFFILGLILVFILGVYPLFVSYGLYKRRWWALPAATSVGLAMIIWILVQGVTVEFGHFLQGIYLGWGAFIAILSLYCLNEVGISLNG